MMQLSNTIGIIGAGPIGLIVAIELCKKGYSKDLFIFEEHELIGRPVHCAGLISNRCFNIFRYSSDLDYVQNKVRGAIFYSPLKAKELVVEREQTQAFVIDREIYDRTLAEIVESEGVRIYRKCRIEDVVESGEGYKLYSTKGQSFRVKILVNAEGARYLILRKVGLKSPDNKFLLTAIQYELNNVKNIDQDYVEIFTGNLWAPGFFAWLIPLDEKRARIGLATCRRPAIKYLNHLILKHPMLKDRVNNSKITKVLAGRVVISGPLSKCTARNFIAVGDAGGFCKPTTGGGLYYGGLSAKLAAKMIDTTITSEDYTKIPSFDRMWRRLFGKEIVYMRILRDIVFNLNDLELEEMFSLARELSISDIASKIGDIDYQSNVVKELVGCCFRGMVFKKIIFWNILYRMFLGIFDHFGELCRLIRI